MCALELLNIVFSSVVRSSEHSLKELMLSSPNCKQFAVFLVDSIIKIGFSPDPQLGSEDGFENFLEPLQLHS